MKLLSLLASLLIITSLQHVHGTSNYDMPPAIIKSACAVTLYPDICYSSMFSTTDDTQRVSTKVDVIELAINKTKDAIRLANLEITEKLLITATTTANDLTKLALRECVEMGASTLEDLDMVIQELLGKKESLLHQKDDNLITHLSTTITNHETCLDGLIYINSEVSKGLQYMSSIIQHQEHAEKMCSNVLAIAKSMLTSSDTNLANNNNDAGGRRKLKEEVIIWPKWLSATDRKLLQLPEVKGYVTVDKNGKGNYTTVAEAVAAAPKKSDQRYTIKITAGVYDENVEIPKKKTNIMFIGDGRSNTIITGNKNVAGGGVTTSTSATVAVLGAKFLARDITFQNTAGPSGHQAVALRVTADLSAFHKCGMEGYQDTLYVHANRQFYVACVVVGTVDFIFGNAAVVFQNCDIQARKPNPNQRNMLTAHGRSDPNQNTGIVIQKCRISATSDLQPVQANFPTYLGRPWKEYSRTVVMQSTISDVINPAGWYPWDGDFALDTLYYREYQNTGPGADTANRVTWTGWGVIKNTTEAESFTSGSFITGYSWLQDTGFPFSLGL
uniref:pectinesterase-like n=1 Tax=Erigeron canadensis TaxID=72917 RepID=UPI001CB93F68|nr:pectinesterase-like [Erigeron canadensis]